MHILVRAKSEDWFRLFLKSSRYELHVSKGNQNCGLGSLLLQKVEEIAQANHACCDRIFLTAFKPLAKNRLYKSPLPFYLKHGFQVDPISPSLCLKNPKEARYYDYEILSKPIIKPC